MTLGGLKIFIYHDQHLKQRQVHDESLDNDSLTPLLAYVSRRNTV